MLMFKTKVLFSVVGRFYILLENIKKKHDYLQSSGIMRKYKHQAGIYLFNIKLLKCILLNYLGMHFVPNYNCNW